jgi:hypothetical protein
MSILSHELEEAITDPDLNAWHDHAATDSANGALYNLTLGGLNYRIQQNWETHHPATAECTSSEDWPLNCRGLSHGFDESKRRVS